MIRLLFCFLLYILSGASKAQTGYFDRLADSACTLTRQSVVYDPAYYRISYPNGDVPADRGVCTDVIIRAYRKMGVDLQKKVHEDMKAHFHLYPKNWGMSRPDPNIDHRRVPNLMVFFGRKGQSLPLSTVAADYRPGDIVCWDLGSGVTHIGLLYDHFSDGRKWPLVVHNIGTGQVLEDGLFRYEIIGHYRYQP